MENYFAPACGFNDDDVLFKVSVSSKRMKITQISSLESCSSVFFLPFLECRLIFTT